MHKRFVSYALLIATTAAVLLVMVIQPREAALRKKRWDTRQYLLAQTQPCVPDPILGGCYASPPPSGGGGSSSGGGTTNISGIGDPKIYEDIESKCLRYLKLSGYAETLRTEGLDPAIRAYTVNACILAYLATTGKLSADPATPLHLIYKLLINDDAKQGESQGILADAIIAAPARKDGEPLNDYLDPAKDGVAKYLKTVMNIMSDFNNLTTDSKIKPPYLINPLIYVIEYAAAEHNKKFNTTIINVEKQLANLSKPEPKITEEPKKSEPDPEKTEVAVVAEPASKPKPNFAKQLAILFKKFINPFIAIRGNNIARTAITLTKDAQLRISKKIDLMIKAFNDCLEKDECVSPTTRPAP